VTSVAAPLRDSWLQWYGCEANKYKADGVTWLILSGHQSEFMGRKVAVRVLHLHIPHHLVEKLSLICAAD